MATLKERLEAVLSAIGLDMKSKANSSSLANVAISGSYSDLINKPILTGSTNVNSTDLYTNKSKDITVVGVAIGDIPVIDDNFRLLGTDFPCWISAKIISANTVRFYFSNLQFAFYAGSGDSASTLSIYSAKSIENPGATSWTINYAVIKK